MELPELNNEAYINWLRMFEWNEVCKMNVMHVLNEVV